MKVDVDEYVAMIGINRISYYYKLKGSVGWNLKEILKILEIAKTINEEHIDVEVDGVYYRVTAENIAEIPLKKHNFA